MTRQLGAIVIAVAVAAPVVAVWAVVAGDLMAIPWADDPVTPSRAIDRGDFAQAIRLFEAGQSASIAYDNPIPDEPSRQTTPMYEAIRVHEPDLVRVLLDLGAAPDVALRTRFACLALSYDDTEIAEMILARSMRTADCAVPSAGHEPLAAGGRE